MLTFNGLFCWWRCGQLGKGWSSLLPAFLLMEPRPCINGGWRICGQLLLSSRCVVVVAVIVVNPRMSFLSLSSSLCVSCARTLFSTRPDPPTSVSIASIRPPSQIRTSWTTQQNTNNSRICLGSGGSIPGRVAGGEATPRGIACNGCRGDGDGCDGVVVVVMVMVVMVMVMVAMVMVVMVLLSW